MWLLVAILSALTLTEGAHQSLPRSASDGLRVVAPTTAIAGDNAYTVHVHADSPSDVHLALKDSQNIPIATQNGLLVPIDNGQWTEFHLNATLEIPEAATPGDHALNVNVSGHDIVKIRVDVKGKNRIILIQTDKPIYRPGQTINGRVLVLDNERTASEGNVSITIKDRSSYIMARFANRTLDAGVAKFRLPLSDQPVLGAYTICASYEGQPRGQRKCFETEVDEYVLPTFSCSVTPSVRVMKCDNSRRRSQKICFTVTSEYTYGQKVNGKIQATIFPTSKWRRCTGHVEIANKHIKGTASVCVRMCTMTGYECSEDIEINANVTDKTSGRTYKCGGDTIVHVRSSPNQLKIINNNPVFYPCQQSAVTVQATSVAGLPVSTSVTMIATMTATVQTQSEHYSTCIESTTKVLRPQTKAVDGRGIATFDFCIPCDTLRVHFYARQAVDDGSFISADATRYFIHSPEKIELTGVVDNVTKSDKVKVGSVATVDAAFSCPAPVDYYVVNKGRIIYQGSCNPILDTKIQEKHPRLCYTNRMNYSCRLTSLQVTTFMQPTITFVVSQRQLSASRFTFTVERKSDLQMSLSFDKKQVKPGDNVTVVITSAAPASYVGIVAVDQSVYLQQNKNHLTTEILENELGYFDEYHPLHLHSYTCGGYWTWDCPCSCYGIIRYPDRDRRRCCPRVCRARYIPQKCNYVSATSYFQASGIYLSGSSIPPPTACSPPIPTRPPVRSNSECCDSWRRLVSWGKASSTRQFFAPPRSSTRLMAPGLPGREINSFPDVPDQSQRSSSKATPLAEPTRVRKYFPETWLWIDKKLKSTETSFKQLVTVPDTITSWVADAFSVSSYTALSIANPATLWTFKPFFIAINLPYSVIRGEIAEITLTVYNYLPFNLTAYVDIEVEPSHFQLVKSKNIRQLFADNSISIEVPSGEGSSLSLRMVPLKAGHLPIKCIARTTKAADVAIRNLLVEPEGVEQEYSLSTLLCPDRNCLLHQFSIDLPSNYVPDSEQAAVSLTADFMGPSVKGLDKLLQLPTGCGEQNMLKFAPAVYITRYLLTLDQLDDETREKSLRYMQTGYQREMTYQRTDGSYSAFGNRDPCGSMWLTAFVVRSFSQADGVLDMYIDPLVQNKAIQWIKRKQTHNGIFPSICKPIHKEMQGCSGGDCTLTAYVTVSLLEAGVPADDPTVVRALNYLTHNCPRTCSSPYIVALVSYALCKANHPQADAAIQQLKECAVINQSMTHWEYTKTPQCDSPWYYHCRSRPCDIETTAYALLALTCQGDIWYSVNSARWLLEQRNPRGGFRSTQDTVVALQALSGHVALTTSSGSVNSAVNISINEGLLDTLMVDQSNAMQVQTVQVPSIPNAAAVEVCGTGCILAQLSVQYNIPAPDATAAIAVSATAVQVKGACKYQLQICNKWLLKNPDSSNMAITDLTMFSGFQPLHPDLKQLEKNGACQIKRTEFEGRHLRIYLDEVNSTECCFNVTTKRTHVVDNLQGVPVVTYNYYQPQQAGGTMLYPRHTC